MRWHLMLVPLHIIASRTAQAVLAAMHLINALAPIIPSKYKPAAMVALLIGNWYVAECAHYSTPEGRSITTQGEQK